MRTYFGKETGVVKISHYESTTNSNTPVTADPFKSGTIITCSLERRLKRKVIQYEMITSKSEGTCFSLC